MVREFPYISLLALVVAGCASTPDVTATYYLPKASTQIVVTQTLGCNTAGDTLITATSVIPTTSYSADRNTPQTLDYKGLAGTLVDADTTVNFSADGRLSGINATTAGEGLTFVKAAIAVASTIALFDAQLNPTPSVRDTTIKDICTAIATHSLTKSGSGGESGAKVVTLTYKASLSYVRATNPKADDKKPHEVKPCPSLPELKSCFALVTPLNGAPTNTLRFKPDADSADIYGSLVAIDGVGDKLLPVALISSEDDLVPLASWKEGNDQKGSYLPLVLNKIAVVHLQVSGLTPQISRDELWSGTARVPMTGDGNTYRLPIPEARLFGKTQFALSLSDDGGISKLEYGQTSGAGDALSALSAIGQAAAGPTDAQQASALQAEGDLIYQQQRVVACKANHAACTSK